MYEEKMLLFSGACSDGWRRRWGVGWGGLRGEEEEEVPFVSNIQMKRNNTNNNKNWRWEERNEKRNEL